MTRDQEPVRNSGRPRAEPEIIPPGRDERERDLSGIWMRIDERDGVRRVYIARPSVPSIILGLLIVGFVAALAFLAVAGLLLVWIPILIGGIVLALLSGTVRRHWRRLRGRWSRR